MKKLLAILLSILSLTSCSAVDSSVDNTSSEQPVETVIVKKTIKRTIEIEDDSMEEDSSEEDNHIKEKSKEIRKKFISNVQNTFENIESGKCNIDYSISYNVSGGKKVDKQNIKINAASNAILFDITKSGQNVEYDNNNPVITPYKEKCNQVIDFEYNNIFEFTDVEPEKDDSSKEDSSKDDSSSEDSSKEDSSEPEYETRYPYRNGYWYNFQMSATKFGTVSDVFYNLVYYSLLYDEDMTLIETDDCFEIKTDIHDISEILEYFYLENNYSENQNVPCTVKMILDKNYKPMSFELTSYDKNRLNDAVKNNCIYLDDCDLENPDMNISLKVTYSKINNVQDIDLTDIHNNISNEYVARDFKCIIHP